MNGNGNGKSPAGALMSFVSGLFGTRQQITYGTVGTFLFVILYSLRFVRSVQDAAILVGAMQFVVMAVMVFWFGGKWLEVKGPAGSIEQNPDIPAEDPLARLERLED